MPARGRLIVFEGGEASGKSTQAEILAKDLGAVLTREPGGTALGEHLRPLLLEHSVGGLSPHAELLLMLAARAQHVDERIEPLLDAGHHVVCDRFTASTLAYQGYGRGLPLDEVAEACAIAARGLEPDLTVLIEVSPEEATRRRGRPTDKIEGAGVAFHERVVAGYRALATTGGASWVSIDGDAAIEEVAERVRRAVLEHLGPLAASAPR